MTPEPLALALPALVEDGLLTYLLHSTLLIGGAWAATRTLKRLSPAAREALWRTALLGAFLTASLQTALGYESVAGRMAVASRDTPPPAAAVRTVSAAREAGAPAASRDNEGRAAAAPPVPASRAPAAPRLPSLAAVLAALWAAGALVAALRFGRTRRRLRRRLAARRPVESGPLRETLDRLAAHAQLPRRVRLTTAGDLASPVALGLRNPEICLPARVDELSPAQQEAMLAHELAHHHRRDPLWLAVGRWVETLFFFQPLNLLAGRRLREEAEVLCDAWAVERTGERRALAECLARVAEWMIRPHLTTVPASAMAQRGSTLERRVRHLLEDERGARGPGSARLRTLLALAPLVLVAALAPAVSRASVPAHTPRVPGEVAALDDLSAALDALDEQMFALERELVQLVELAARIEDPPAALSRGVARLARRLAALGADRTALLNRIRMELESNR